MRIPQMRFGWWLEQSGVDTVLKELRFSGFKDGRPCWVPWTTKWEVSLMTSGGSYRILTGVRFWSLLWPGSVIVEHTKTGDSWAEQEWQFVLYSLHSRDILSLLRLAEDTCVASHSEDSPTSPLLLGRAAERSLGSVD